MEIRHHFFDRITMDPEKCFGKPCIRGLRMPVASVLAYLSGGMSSDEILEEWPELEREDIYQALGFAAVMMEERVGSRTLPCALPQQGFNSGNGPGFFPRVRLTTLRTLGLTVLRTPAFWPIGQRLYRANGVRVESRSTVFSGQNYVRQLKFGCAERSNLSANLPHWQLWERAAVRLF